ncbi:GmrSD restriction endonuclease domain-containing protein [Helicobacter salomonis]|uniref:GmrSD restriction endonuclease domain-containing protein n=1 Tax=Helicobacter salomonis TaxID=56878 RepID=UPI000CF06210|nr:DUF262 domain-containing protein [Helicobacter salomonis]
MPICNHGERKFREIVRLLENGEFQIPRFQRNFVWTKEQVAKFIDSILRGFPTSSFVLWKTKEKLQACTEIGHYELGRPHPDEYTHYVLDGQQRITALFMVYKGLQISKSARVRENYKDIWLRVEANENGEYCFVKNPKEENPFQAVSAHDLITQSILDIQDKYQLDKQTAMEFEAFKYNIEDYLFPTIEITQTALEEIIEIFARINTGGTKLSTFEILCAKFYIPDETDESQAIVTLEGFNVIERSQALMGELEKLDYSLEKPLVILQLIAYHLRAHITSPLKEKISIPALLKLSAREVQNGWNAIAPCFKHAAQFLKHDLNIPASGFLSDPALFMLIAYFYVLSQRKSPNAGQISNLRRLFFRSAFLGKIQNDHLSIQFEIVKRIYEEKPVDFDKELPLELSQEFLITDRFSTRNALHRAVLCVLATLEPKNFDNNSKVILDNLFLHSAQKRNLHHFFPKNHLKYAYPRSNADAIANMTCIDARLNRSIKDTPPRVYIPKYQQSNSKCAEGLATHLIVGDDMRLFEDYDYFLQTRAQAILEKIRDLT